MLKSPFIKYYPTTIVRNQAGMFLQQLVLEKGILECVNIVVGAQQKAIKNFKTFSGNSVTTSVNVKYSSNFQLELLPTVMSLISVASGQKSIQTMFQ